MGQVNECLQHIATDLNTYTFDELNADENLINFENGLLRLTDLKLLPHTPEVLLRFRFLANGTAMLHLPGL